MVNTFIFSFVRMNPPTPGHLVLVKTMMDKAIAIGIDTVYLLVSSSIDGKNPLPCSVDSIPKPKTKQSAEIVNNMIKTDLIYKSTILDKMIASYKQTLITAESNPVIKKQIKNLNIIVLCSSGNPFGFIDNIIKTDFINANNAQINMVFIVGRDRADFLDTIVDNFKTRDYIKSIDGIILEREGMEELKASGVGKRKIEDIDASEYSASFVRGLVKNKKLEDFKKVYKPYLEARDIEKLYKTIEIGIQMKTPASKDEDENPRSRYFDGKLLPIINEGFKAVKGGKKTKKSKKTKKTKKAKKTKKSRK
jgi:hypothetical protein